MEIEEEILAKLSPKVLARAKMASQVQLMRQPTASTGLNAALRGGIGYGRQTLVWGSKSAGKSTFCLSTLGIAQSQGKRAAFIDSEQSFDPMWAERLGVNTGKLVYTDVKTIEDMVSAGVEFMKAGIDIVTVDSISALLSSAYFEKDKKGDELKELSGTKQIGSEARELANGVKMLNYANKQTALILISQVRNKITTYGAMHQATGGHAVDFFSSTVVKLWSSAREADQIQGEVFNGDLVLKEPIGREVNWTIDKNKLGPPNKTGKYNLFYDGDFIGIDNIGEAVDLGVAFGIVNKSGNWLTYEDLKVNGKDSFSIQLRQRPELAEKLVKEVEDR
ncbi:UvsX-like recombinase [Streptomyces phage Jay2Jay]|uniref:RecA-like DNA recombinase n=2 Tax=Samistivirus jay2jay TaxID=2560786 RepID=A0A221SAZ4_9CAUD|nr:UvsX-like recombinase [Streptomyces phage Jay2Jay]AIW02585.1 RecA-like DNA recombinase [Streptomyces phage Jay2Jay]ASN73160.1 RecA-like DNA recombinase [Streptomyces phage Warpy]